MYWAVSQFLLRSDCQFVCAKIAFSQPGDGSMPLSVSSCQRPGQYRSFGSVSLSANHFACSELLFRRGSRHLVLYPDGGCQSEITFSKNSTGCQGCFCRDGSVPLYFHCANFFFGVLLSSVTRSGFLILPSGLSALFLIYLGNFPGPLLWCVSLDGQFGFTQANDDVFSATTPCKVFLWRPVSWVLGWWDVLGCQS